jgi:uncharacterized membrane protein YqiK
MSRSGGKITFVLIAILVTAIIGGLVSLIFSRFVVGSGGSGTQHDAAGQAGMSRPAETASPEGGGGPDTSKSQ